MEEKYEIRCVCCLKFYSSDKPGLKGIFSFQSFGAGVCPNCREKYQEPDTFRNCRTIHKVVE